ncbi:MAG TPA: hypothetical protein VL947_11430, partial [Cytophagales bacterium]|nr:hypothetical protein [Cytophagales bacterium]
MKPTSTLKAFLWAFCLMLVTAAKAQGPYSYINGPAESCPGKEETYFYSYNGFTGFIFQSCTLTVHGG